MDDYPPRPYDFTDPEFVSAYDELPRWSALIGSVLLEHVPLRPNVRLLDVGTGTGFPLIELAQQLGPTCRACGIDVWRPACERARRKIALHGIANITVLDADAAAMPFADDQFDLIVSNVGINNFDDPPRVLAECWRVCRPGGTIALASNLQGHFAEFYEVFRETLLEHNAHANLARLDQHVHHRTTMVGLRQLLQSAGFTIAQEHQTTLHLRFLNGAAFLRHFFIRQAFLDAWRAVLEPAEESTLLRRIEQKLGRIAEQRGELRLSVPVGYVKGRKE